MKISRVSILRWLAIAFLSLAVILLVTQLIRYSRIRSGFPPGTLIGGVPVGGLTQQQAADRIAQAFSIPLELSYGEDIIQVKPSTLGFELNVDAMIAAADQLRVNAPFWSSFWDYLWNRIPTAYETPLVATVEEKRLRAFLINEIAPRYDKSPEASQPIAGTVNFQIGSPGEVLDIDRSITLIDKALKSPDQRSVTLAISNTEPPRPSMENLKILLKQILDRSRFDGLTEIYVLDLQNGNEINFTYENGEEYPPGIAFTAASTIKIPIMISVFKRLPEPLSQTAADMIQLMIDESRNEPADALMQTYLDVNVGPLLVSDDMEALGYENTFMAGYFAPGEQLKRRYSTPANQRADYDTSPDPFDQTTTADIGNILADIYYCAEKGGGALVAVFPGEITQSECQLMITFLARNQVMVLLQAGLPDGTKNAHKQGYITELDGLMHQLIDILIVYSPGGNYIVTLAMYQPTQLIYDIANNIAAQISSAVYNYFNIS